MKKRYILWAIFIFIFGMCGCSGTKEVSVRQSNDYWEVSDIKLKNLPPDADISGITDEGIYYNVTLREKMHGPELRSDLAWHFLSFSGEDITICETDCYYYYDDLLNDTNLILNITFMEEDEVVQKVLELSPDGNVRQVAGEGADCIYASDGYMLIEQRYREESQEQEVLILSDTAGTETIVYPAVCGYDARTGLGDGEQIVCASMNNEAVIFIVETLENGQYQQSSLYRYDIEAKKITDTILLEYRVAYAVCKGDLLLSEEHTGNPDNTVKIGKIAKGEYQGLSEFPVSISSGRFFCHSAFTANGFYLTSYSPYCHFWNTDTNELYIYDFGETENKLSRDFPTKQGIRYATQEGDEFFVRTLSVKSQTP